MLEFKGEPQSFFGQIYYRATFNKNNRIKSVTRFGKDKEAKETYELLWSKSGARSEYKIVFHKEGNVSRIDSIYFQINLVMFGQVGLHSLEVEVMVDLKKYPLAIQLDFNIFPIILIIQLLERIIFFLR